MQNSLPIRLRWIAPTAAGRDMAVISRGAHVQIGVSARVGGYAQTLRNINGTPSSLARYSLANTLANDSNATVKLGSTAPGWVRHTRCMIEQRLW